MRFWHWILTQLERLRRRPPPPSPPSIPAIAKTVTPPLAPLQARREARLRELERRRLRHDKFVTPKGQPPVHKSRPETQEVKPKLVPTVPVEPPKYVDDAEMILADKHHEDTEKVLYKETEMYGEFNFRDTILQQLERYFVYLRRMKKRDRDSYGYYRRVGAQLLPYVATGAYNRIAKDDEHNDDHLIKLPEWFDQNRPSFGCFAYGTDPQTEKFEQEGDGHGLKAWVPKFMYYTKYDRPPPQVQRMGGGDIYKLTLWWDQPNSESKKIAKRHGVPQEFAVFISKDGKTLVALKQCQTKVTTVRAKRSGKRDARIPQKVWKLGDSFEDWAKEHHKDPQQFLTGIFLYSIQKQQHAQGSMIQVHVTHDKMTAVFGLNVHRTAYFFQDRDYHLTEGGTRKRIFHVVSPHTRKDGSAVKMHFRGERRFTWAGYDVLVTVPGRDHVDLNEVTFGAVDEHWWDHKEPMVTMPQLGKRMAALIDPKAPSHE